MLTYPTLIIITIITIITMSHSSHASNHIGTCTQCNHNPGIIKIHEFINEMLHNEETRDHHYIWNNSSTNYTNTRGHSELTRWNELIRITNIYSTGRDEIYIKYKAGQHIKHCIFPIIGNFTQADVSPLGDIEPDNQLLNEIYRSAEWQDVTILEAKMVRFSRRIVGIPDKKTIF